MCGRFTSLLTPELLTAIYGVCLPESLVLEPRYNIAPSQPVMVVRQDHSGRRELAPVNWGLIPSWSRDVTNSHRPINARAETVFEKPSFRSALWHRRCVVPASGYYEWQKNGDKGKQPWYITSNDGSPLSFAGLWEHWQSPDGSEIETCAIITVAANKLMSSIHDRMPVVLEKDCISKWLNHSSPCDDVSYVLQPCPSAMLQAWPVAHLVNNPAHDSAECITPLSPKTAVFSEYEFS